MSSEPRRKTISGYTVVHRVSDRDREVYLANARNGAGKVVLVVVDVDDALSESFDAEVRQSMALKHPAFTRLVDVTADGSRRVVAFEHVDGTSLHRLLRYAAEQKESLGDGAALHIGVALLEALNEAHGCKTDDGKLLPLVHGQLGPHQVLISWEGEVKLLGFGLAPVFARAVTALPDWLMPFTAPEVRAGARPTTASNVYTAGAMLWSLLSGQPMPEDGSRPPKLSKMRPDLPPSVSFPLDRALEPEANKRISAKALQVGLTRALEVADREELRWAMEVCRVRCTVDEEFLPQESFPHSSVPARASYPAGGSSLPPDSEEDETGTYQQSTLLAKARLMGPLPWDKHDPDEPASAEPSTSPRTRGASSRRSLRTSARRGRRSGRAGDSDAPPSSSSGGASPGANGAPPKPTSLRAGAIQRPPKRGFDDGSATIPAPARDGERKTINFGTQAIGVEIARDGYAGDDPPISVAPASQAPASQAPHSYPLATSPSHAPTDSQFPQQQHGYPASFYPSYLPYGYPGHPPSQGAPPSAYPIDGVMPFPVPPGAPPISYYAAPGSMMAPPPTAPTKWIAAVAVTALASFVLGVLIASGGVQIRLADGDVASAATSVASAIDTAETAAPATAPATTSVDAVAPEPTSAALPEPEVVDAEPAREDVVANHLEVRNSEQAARLPAHRAHLTVHSAIGDAHVYVHGRHVGPLDQRHEVDCGMRYVRLGTAPPTTWLEPGQSIDIPCRGDGEITIQPRPAPWRKRGQFLR